MKDKFKLFGVLVFFLFFCAMIGGVSAATYNITDESYGNYFDECGYINDTNVVEGDVLDFSGGIYNKDVYVDRPLNLTSSDKTGTIFNGVIIVLFEASGTNITDLVINNTNHIGDPYPGALVIDGASDVNVANNIIINNMEGGDSFGLHMVGSSNSKVKANQIITTGEGTGSAVGIPPGVPNPGNFIPGNGYFTYGIYLDMACSGNVFDSNTVHTTGSSATVDWAGWSSGAGGIYPTLGVRIYSDSNDNTFSNNSILTDYSMVGGAYDTLMGVQITRGCSGNEFLGNTINTTAYSYGYGLEIVGEPDKWSNNNLISNNFINTVGIRDHDMQSYANGVKVSAYTNNTVLHGNSVSAVAPHFAYGVYLEDFTGSTLYNTLVEGNTVYAAAHVNYVFELWQASGHTITGNVITGVGNYSMGIGTHTSSYNNITNNNITITGDNSASIGYNVDAIPASNDGIKFISNSDNNLAESNTININGNANSGVYIYGSDGNTARNNTIKGNGNLWGICIVTSDDSNITSNNITNCTEGINLYRASETIITDNTVTNCVYDGIALTRSTNNTISRNDGVTGNVCGVRLNSSNSNLVSDNNLSRNIWAGISLVSSHSNEIRGNTVSHCQEGMYLYASNNNTISGCTACYNTWEGIAIHDSSNNTVSSNLNITGNYGGIRIIGTSSGNQISNNTVTGNTWSAISLDTAGHNTISANTLSNSHVGIALSASSGNTINSNIITSNDWDGVLLQGGYNNTLTGNTFSNGGYGVRILDSASNSVHHNNFISNHCQAYDNSTSSTNNSWDDGSTGNYYNDWNTTNPRPVTGGSSVDNHPQTTPF